MGKEDWVKSPHEIAYEIAISKGFTVKDLVDKLGFVPSGNEPITEDVAKKFALAFGTSSNFWMKAQESYLRGKKAHMQKDAIEYGTFYSRGGFDNEDVICTIRIPAKRTTSFGRQEIGAIESSALAQIFNGDIKSAMQEARMIALGKLTEELENNHYTNAGFLSMSVGDFPVFVDENLYKKPKAKA